MLAKKRSSSKKTTARSSRSISHYNAILIEELQSQFKFVVEHAETAYDKLSEKIDNFRQETEARFTIIEAVLKQHSTMLKQNEERWDQNDARWEQNDARWEQNAAHLQKIETVLERVADRVDHHDSRIEELRHTAGLA